jgi:hypothetical protein
MESLPYKAGGIFLKPPYSGIDFGNLPLYFAGCVSEYFITHTRPSG